MQVPLLVGSAPQNQRKPQSYNRGRRVVLGKSNLATLPKRMPWAREIPEQTAWNFCFGWWRAVYGLELASTRPAGKHRFFCLTKPIHGEWYGRAITLTWFIIGFWGCTGMWLISLAADLGLARDPDVAQGRQWLPLISAIISFIGMCYFGNATSMFGW